MSDEDYTPYPPLGGRRTERRRPRTSSPTIMIGLNLALLAFLLIVAKRVLLTSSTTSGVEDLVAVADGMAVIPGTSLRIPVEPAEGAERALFIGDWAQVLGVGDATRTAAALTAALAQRRPGRSVEAVVLHAPSLTLADASRLLGFAPTLHPDLVAFVPAARAPFPPEGANDAARSAPRLFEHSEFPADRRVPDEILTNPTRPRLFLADTAASSAPADPAERERLVREVEWALRFVIRNDMGRLAAAGCATAMVGWTPPAGAGAGATPTPEAMRAVATEARAAYVDGAFLTPDRADRVEALADWLSANW